MQGLTKIIVLHPLQLGPESAYITRNSAHHSHGSSRDGILTKHSTITNEYKSDTSREIFMRDLKHSIFFDVNHTYQDQTGNTKVTLHNNPVIDSEGVHILRSNTSYVGFPSIMVVQ